MGKRKIRLRAWYEKSQTWVLVNIGEEIKNLEAQKIYTEICRSGGRWFQYVDVFDKKGVNLWEGHIVEATLNVHGKESSIKFMAKIIYSEYVGAFQISYRNENGQFVHDDVYGKYFLEVKGNTTENPELLTPNKN